MFQRYSKYVQISIGINAKKKNAAFIIPSTLCVYTRGNWEDVYINEGDPWG